MSKAALKYGLISGAMLAVFMAASTPFTLQEGTSLGVSETLGYISMFLSLVLIFFGIREHKIKALDGEIDFKEGLQVGATIAVISSLIYVVSWMIISGIYPEVNERIADMYRLDIEKEALSELEKQEAFADVDKMFENYKNPFFKFGITLLEILPLGLIIALASAFILRSKGDD